MPYPDELRTKESVDFDRQDPLPVQTPVDVVILTPVLMPGADGDSRPIDAPHCPRCGSYGWIYKGDRQVTSLHNLGGALGRRAVLCGSDI